jgi:hypothetical protein
MGPPAGASLRRVVSAGGLPVLNVAELFEVAVHPLALLRRESADVLIGVLHSLFRHRLRHGGHGGLLQRPATICGAIMSLASLSS